MISYANQVLFFPDAGLAASTLALYDLGGLFEWPADGPWLSAARWARPSGVVPPPRVLLGRLCWPKDAARFSTFHALIDTAGLARIRAAVYNPYRAGLLKIDDGSSGISALMWMLPPRPVRQSTDRKNEPYLLSLVDDRYFWWMRAANVAVAAGVTTWAQLYAAIAAGLGISLVADSIPAAYLTPPAGFSATYEYLPPLLDAVALNVGQRIVRGLDGTVRAMNAQTSRAVILSNLAQNWTIGAGGQLAIGWV